MKTLWLILAVSLGGNVALLLRSPSPAPAQKPEAGPLAAIAAAPDPGAVSSRKTSASVNLAPIAAAPVWSWIQSDDLATLVARLRRAGFPPHVIRAVVLAGVERWEAARADELYARNADVPYWKDVPNRLEDAALKAAYEKLETDRTSLLERTLGGEKAVPDPIYEAYLARRYGDLPPEKMTQLQALVETYEEQREAVRPMGIPGPAEEKAALDAIEREMRADLGRLLTPAELAAYDLRSGPTAIRLRQQLETFSPSQAEFDALLPLYRDLDARFPLRYASGGADDGTARQQADQALQTQIAALLGPERFADFQQVNADPMLTRLVRRLGLPLAAARAASATQADATERAATLRADATITPAQRDAQLGALAQSAEAQLARTLGARGAEVYCQYYGYWLRALAPAAASTPPGPP